ncbi:MAG TPA: crosslink repair DNA glycosylase YcaQ family protein [Actinomycetota bacterium]|nr:crosslink repair DNA glycosylase YcaQ family protein [Actinomycetota bacterium]
MIPLEVPLELARRLAITKQRLAGPPPTPNADGIVELAVQLGCLQIDPIRVVEHPQYLIPWSRLGHYEHAELDKAMWEEKRLFHYWAHAASLVPTSDYPIHQVMMRRYPAMYWSVHHERLVAFLDANKTLRRHILLQLRKKGPLRTSDFKDLAVKSYKSSGWNTDRNVDRMLDYLWTKGKVMIVGRTGQQRVWDLAERWFPEWTPTERLSLQQSTRLAIERSVKAMGIAMKKQIWQYFTRWRYHDLPAALEELERKGILVRVDVPGVRGEWHMHRDDLELFEKLREGQWEPRTTLLSPFDPLIADRTRTKVMWGFDYAIEIYVPKHKRKYGYYVLPILIGDTLVGRLDPVMDRKSGILTINNIWREAGTPNDRATGEAITGAIEELAVFVGAQRVDYAARPRPRR